MKNQAFSKLLLIVLSLTAGLFAPTAHADFTGDFDKLCGNVVSNLGCSDVASEYSIIFGSATAAVALAKSQGLISSANSCKTGLTSGDPNLQYILSVIDTISGSGVGHFIDCVCDVNFANSSCSGALSKGAEDVAKGFATFGKAALGELKKLGCDVGLGGCSNLSVDQKKAIYFGCRQYGYTENEIRNLSVFGFGDPSGKAYKDLAKAAPCFFLRTASDLPEMNYFENSYHSFLACGFHRGVAVDDPGAPKNPGYRQCMDGAACSWKGADKWVCKPGVVGVHVVSGPPPAEVSKNLAAKVAAQLGAQCGISFQDPAQVSCSTYERYGACLKSLGSCKTKDGIHWDNACCRLEGSGAGAPPQVKKARAIVELVGPSCAVSGQDPLEVDCGSGGTYAKCFQSAGACKSSDGWHWNGACCRLKGGNANPSHEYRRAVAVLKKIGGKDAKLNDLDAVEVRCRTLPAYVACTKQLPRPCQAASGHDYWQQACCRLHSGAGW